MRLSLVQLGSVWLGLVVAVCPPAGAMEHVTLKNGFVVDCTGRSAVGDKVRLYLGGTGGGEWNEANYLEVAADAVDRVDSVAEQPRGSNLGKAAVVARASAAVKPPDEAVPSRVEMHELLAHAGAAHHIDEDLLASVVRAESGGQVRAVSRTGARGLMQLMPGTASALGVEDAFQAEQNIAGGTAYLDTLLTRYRNNLALALAAYNAGPGAVDKYHGVPPYRETRAYVARVIREFNRRKQMAPGSLVARAQ